MRILSKILILSIITLSFELLQNSTASAKNKNKNIPNVVQGKWQQNDNYLILNKHYIDRSSINDIDQPYRITYWNKKGNKYKVYAYNNNDRRWFNLYQLDNNSIKINRHIYHKTTLIS